MFCATVQYPFNNDESFDYERYTTLAKRYADILGDNCTGFEVRKGLATPGEQHPRFICVASFWIKSGEAFGASMQHPMMTELMKEISKFYSIQPVRQFEAVLIPYQR
jgi:hypothetical protein